MSDCITELITSNLESALNGKPITILGDSFTTTCERERYVNVVAGRYPFILLSGPIVQVATRSHRTMNCDIHYQVLLSDNSIPDEYDPDSTVSPITKSMGNVAADLIKMVMLSPNRGGYAHHTEVLGWSYYFDSDGDTPIFQIDLEINVVATINNFDPYYTGG